MSHGGVQGVEMLLFESLLSSPPQEAALDILSVKDGEGIRGNWGSLKNGRGFFFYRQKQYQGVREVPLSW